MQAVFTFTAQQYVAMQVVFTFTAQHLTTLQLCCEVTDARPVYLLNHCSKFDRSLSRNFCTDTAL
jgi:hypothetical protein